MDHNNSMAVCLTHKCLHLKHNPAQAARNLGKQNVILILVLGEKQKYYFNLQAVGLMAVT